MPRSESELAEARCRAYGLFAAIALDGVTEVTVGHLEAVAGLHAAADPWRCDGGFDFEAAAAEHYRALTHEVFPYASVFVDPAAMPGGATSDRFSVLYARIGVDRDPRGPSPDHVGLVLRALASLCGAESDAAADGRAAVVARVRALQAEVLDLHLLPWWPAFAEALAWGDSPFYGAWSQAVTELIVHHHDDLPGGAVPATDPVSATPSLDEVLNAEATGLTEVAETLLVPARVGAFISRASIGAMGRRERLPAGFGARQQVMTNLLRSASTYDAWCRLVDQLRARFASARGFHRAFGAKVTRGGAERSEVWAARCERTDAGLERLMRASTDAGGLDGPAR